jgi:hypothetical protein
VWMDVYRQTDRQTGRQQDKYKLWMDGQTDRHIYEHSLQHTRIKQYLWSVCVCLCRLYSAVDHESVWGTGGTAPHILILGTDFVLAARSGCFIQGCIVARHQTKVRVRHILSGHWT